MTAAGLDGWKHVYSGKVRDLYEPLDGSDTLLVVASDRISAYDHVLSTPVPDKGRILTGLSLWWFERLADLVPNHVVSLDVPAPVAGRAMICARLQMFPVECVARGYLTGSGLAEYRAAQAVCGVALPPGLEDGSRLPEPIFTPATKAEEGHDMNISLDEMKRVVGEDLGQTIADASIAIYKDAAAYALDRGIIIADTKMEFGLLDGELILIDELLTPDSSRYWPVADYLPGGSPPNFDKQYVRDWLEASGWNKQPPAPELPTEVVEGVARRYREAYEWLTGEPLPA